MLIQTYEGKSITEWALEGKALRTLAGELVEALKAVVNKNKDSWGGIAEWADIWDDLESLIAKAEAAGMNTAHAQNPVKS